VVLVEIWSDVVCPWCYVGAGRFELAVSELPWRDEVESVYRPFELDPDVPPGGMPIAEYLQRKFGSAATVEAVEGRVGEAAHELGLELRWDRVRRRNTFDAHRLLTWTLADGGPQAQRDLKQRLFRAYFTDGLAIDEHEVLAGLTDDPAAALGLLRSDGYGPQVRALEAEAREASIHAVPTYVIERRFAIPGAQDPETFRLVLQRARDRLLAS
jgi:predicted DsbA family dithiol-disulfide isomerase